MSTRAIGFLLLIVGAVLLFFGYQGSQSIVDRTTETFTGRFTDKTTIFLVLGLVSAVAGAITLLVPSSRARLGGGLG